MPKQTYLYRCPVCGAIEEHDAIAPFTPPEHVYCACCTAQEMSRLYTAPPVHYHGEGWTGAGSGYSSSVPTLDERAKMRGPLDLDPEDKEPLHEYRR